MQQTTRPEPTEEQIKSAGLFIRVLLLLLASTFLATALPLPWKAVAPALAVASIVVAVIGLVKAVRAGLPGTLRITYVLGIGAGAFFLLTTLAQVLFWPLTAAFEDCNQLAVTQSAREACLGTYEDKLMNFTNLVNP